MGSKNLQRVQLKHPQLDTTHFFYLQSFAEEKGLLNARGFQHDRDWVYLWHIYGKNWDLCLQDTPLTSTKATLLPAGYPSTQSQRQRNTWWRVPRLVENRTFSYLSLASSRLGEAQHPNLGQIKRHPCCTEFLVSDNREEFCILFSWTSSTSPTRCWLGTSSCSLSSVIHSGNISCYCYIHLIISVHRNMTLTWKCSHETRQISISQEVFRNLPHWMPAVSLGASVL